ncbi:MAG TPA: SUMF1/EgtB/PvdO family nonheme iron enzyme [Trueperaceae bacterium]|nr:SUMF1/EgtB/PvdO family nonheme iron enzyme [Trueperaceae bacterium]
MTSTARTLSRTLRLVVAIATAWLVGSAAAAPNMVSVKGGDVELLFPVADEGPTLVAPFSIDVVPVTNADFLRFLEAHPEWQRGNVPEVFANENYLAAWPAELGLGDLDPAAPVTGVSWFAAAAYCEARGGRLPTEAEWEFVANAGYQGPRGRDEPGFNERILVLTANRSHQPGPVGQGDANFYGVKDLHGLVWEWVFDIGSSFNTGDSRSEGDRRLQLVCGGGSAGAIDKSDYAAFLRYAFRAGLNGAYSSGGLGFRCAA